MDFDVTVINHRTCERYPYSHRVEVYELSLAQEIDQWVLDLSIPCSYYLRRAAGCNNVFYFDKTHFELFLLRWA